MTETINVRWHSAMHHCCHRTFFVFLPNLRVIVAKQGIQGVPADNLGDFTIADCNNRCSASWQLSSHLLMYYFMHLMLLWSLVVLPFMFSVQPSVRAQVLRARHHQVCLPNLAQQVIFLI